MSGNAEEAFEEMTKWKKITLGLSLPVCVAAMAVNAVIHASHGHEEHEEKPEPSYMKIRTKAFPWECDDCGLFEQECHKACQAKKAAA
eukprot:CAMPEP_0113308124 /NCGR_PEP_ID=MMETSP0010_2-20120614/6686_1 /TAXON_ID=216773 ORGANISM="Corethron hystrix, Strain 308" /NCGR_SAMPLE_ID=MMETSP0010_2 /ASSEMBLY_ACC=CAM_ASM_000155 /LENGTH=87 /DNA_ID=CAMNT_0000163099 /DNA_START=460 /DNA_END=723 /DNA_ORIENTATION=+ /assembly_acc=CAM_ASM_000155